MIRRLGNQQVDQILNIINDGARAYEGVIPADRWTDPYMSRDKLLLEIADGVEFWGVESNGKISGVMGMQPVQDVRLIRHAYVLRDHQGQGVGRQLLAHLQDLSTGPVLVETWQDAVWAIRFYQNQGFRQVDYADKERLLRKYWTVPERQIATSVVLANRTWWAIRTTGALDRDPTEDRRDPQARWTDE